MKSRQKERTVVENWEISSDSENENDGLIQNELGTSDLVNRLQIKEERNQLLQTTVKRLNSRIGTEIIDDNDIGASSSVPRRYENSMNVNTLHYQTDADLGSAFYFLTNVKFIFIFFYAYMIFHINSNVSFSVMVTACTITRH